MLLGDHRFLDGVHAADTRAVLVVAVLAVPGSHALEPCDLFGLLVVGGPHEVSLSGAGRRKDALELHRGHHIGKFRVAVGVELRWIERLESPARR